MIRLLFSFVLLTLLVTTVSARFARPDLVKIPVERLVTNLQQQAQREPKNATVRFNLARLHAMAYAKKIDEVEINNGKPERGAWFGYTPAFVPFAKTVVKASDAEALKAAKTHLARAIEEYRRTLKIEPGNLAAQLGLAWAIEQSGEKMQAIQAYRKVIEAGWAKEKELKTGRLGSNYITKEAAEYLIPLLDKEKDGDEIARLKDRTAQLMRLPRLVTPIAIPLEGGLTLADIVDNDARVSFDADGTGARSWSWIHKNAGWLVHDQRQEGKIASGLQMFGSVSFWLFWDNGYQPLALLDDNGDGELTGAELRHLAIWRDANGNGISDPGEVLPLAAYGIVALACRPERFTGAPSSCAAYSPIGVRFQNGQTRASYDVILRKR